MKSGDQASSAAAAAAAAATARSSSTLPYTTRNIHVASLLSQHQQGATISGASSHAAQRSYHAGSNGNYNCSASSSSKPAKFIISRPIRGIMLNPLQLKVLVPRAGRSIEYQLSRATPDTTGLQPYCQSAALIEEQRQEAAAQKAAQEAIYLSIQAQRATDELCAASLSPHTHFDLVLRLNSDCLRAAHLLCKVVYQNVRSELKEMGPYQLHACDPVSSYRLEEMNCKLSNKTGHHHVYLLLQLVSSEAAPAKTKSASTQHSIPEEARQQQQQQKMRKEESQTYLPSYAKLPDFSKPWSPLATLRLVGDGGSDTGVYCVPQLLSLCCEEIRDLLLARGGSGEGELVLQGATQADLVLLARLTYPGTTCGVTADNARQVLRLAARVRAPHLLATAERCLCAQLPNAGAGAELRSDLASLAAQFGLKELAAAVKAAKAAAAADGKNC